MNHFLNGVVRATVETFALPEPILEIGSYQVAGQEDILNLRGLFPGKRYTGLDFRAGPGVDVVGDAERLPQATGSVGTVIAMNTFEHVRRFWRAFAEVERVLRPDGVFLLSVPFYFHIHAFPSDYWRFTPEALHLLLEDYPHRLVGWHGPKRRPANVWAVAFGPDHAPVPPEQHAGYRERLRRYAHEPLSLGRRLRYQLGRWLCGRRPFAPYLDLNHWDTECRSTSFRSTPTPPRRRRPPRAAAVPTAAAPGAASC